MFSHFCEATSHTPPCANIACSPTKTLTALLLTYRAPRSNTDSKLLPYEGVVDPMGNVMEGFCIIRTDERGEKKSGFYCMTSTRGGMDVLLADINSPSIKSGGASFYERIYWSTEC